MRCVAVVRLQATYLRVKAVTTTHACTHQACRRQVISYASDMTQQTTEPVLVRGEKYSRKRVKYTYNT